MTVVVLAVALAVCARPLTSAAKLHLVLSTR